MFFCDPMQQDSVCAINSYVRKRYFYHGITDGGTGTKQNSHGRVDQSPLRPAINTQQKNAQNNCARIAVLSETRTVYANRHTPPQQEKLGGQPSRAISAVKKALEHHEEHLKVISPRPSLWFCYPDLCTKSLRSRWRGFLLRVPSLCL